ncbi:hypothetical protein PAE975_6157 (plasmid) [Pseudomonas aeruginosa]|uniref:hypothetical protein n=1 Tax=Pseudomonas aeruginosa TaxID=287 RepID=UPI00386E7280
MFATFMNIAGHGLRSAKAEVRASVEAQWHYRRAPLSGSDKAFCWVMGLTEGIAKAMRASRVKDQTKAQFDSSAFPQVRFSLRSASQEMLLVEVIRPDGIGQPMEVSSTLSFVEAQAVRKGIQILRDTGVFSLTDRETHELLRCTSSMVRPEALNALSDPRISYSSTSN